MDENDITNYLATLVSQASVSSFEEIMKNCDNTLNAQEHYFTKELSLDLKDRFSPERFIATNMKTLFNSENTDIITDENDQVFDVFYEYKGSKYKILSKGVFSDNEAFVATRLYLEQSKTKRPLSDFNYKAYYANYKESIDLYQNDFPETQMEKYVCKFYIEYGFWNGLFFKPINGLNYIASHPKLIEEFKTDKAQALKHYFQIGMNEGYNITFDPYTYLASNIHLLKEFQKGKKIFLDEATKHYILQGNLFQIKHNSFDHYNYLANNPYRIRKILQDSDGVINWNFFKLTQSEIAKDYLKFHGNARKRIFEPSEFIKKYIHDKNVNYDGKLNINNASEYFVKAYVKYKYVRRGISSINLFQRFVKNRIYDTAYQIPYSITRFVIQNKYY